MKKSSCIAAAALVALAGQALAQPVIDGQLGSGYGAPLWINTLGTDFGDNVPTGLGNPTAVTTGVELRIRLADIGSPTGAIGLCAFVNGGGSSFASNQFAGPLPANTGNLGEPRAINLVNITGNQFITLAGLPTGTPTIDGQRDAAYGTTAISGSVQTTFTGFGNATHGLIDNGASGNGSEIDAVYACKDATFLYILVAGNLEANSNTMEFFLDTTAGGQNQLDGLSASARLARMGNDGTNPGLKFDGAFSPDYYIGINGSNNGTDYVVYADAATIPTTGAGTAWYVGSTVGYGSAANFIAGDVGALDVLATVNNTNIDGVIGNPTNIPSPDVSNGSELDNVYARVIGQNLYVFIGGNLESSFNKVSLFFDTTAGGQNVLRGDNVDIDFNGLNNQAGLIFDADFSADQWLSFTNGNLPVEIYNNSAVLRTDGPRQDFSGFPTDYGAFSGGPKTTNNPNSFDGPRIDAQNGSATSIFTEFSPRLAGDSCFATPLAPVGTAGQLDCYINNLNVAGVPAFPGTGSGAAVTTGMEFRISLAELGWTRSGPIKIAGFVSNGGYNFISNQVIGGLPAATANLGSPTGLDFNLIDGLQYVSVPCPADFDGDGFVTGDDFDSFVAAFEMGDVASDFDGDGFVTGDDFDQYVVAFEAGC